MEEDEPKFDKENFITNFGHFRQKPPVMIRVDNVPSVPAYGNSETTRLREERVPRNSLNPISPGILGDITTKDNTVDAGLVQRGVEVLPPLPSVTMTTDDSPLIAANGELGNKERKRMETTERKTGKKTSSPDCDCAFYESEENGECKVQYLLLLTICFGMCLAIAIARK